MIIIPFICNSIQFWITDNFLKKNEEKNKEKALEEELKKEEVDGADYTKIQFEEKTNEKIIKIK